MARGKVKLAFIVNDSKRKATYQKRKKGLLKKVSEISTLCGVNACAIIHSPFDTEPEVWPSTLEAQRVISQYKRLPNTEQNKRMLDPEAFLRKRIAKINKEIEKVRIENRKKQVTELIHNLLLDKRGLQNLTLRDLNDVQRVVNEKLKEIDRRIEAKRVASHQVAPPLPPPSPPPPSPPPLTSLLESLKSTKTENAMQTNTVPVQEEISWPQWVIDYLNETSENMGSDQEGEDQNTTLSTSNPTATSPADASSDQGSAHFANP